MGAVVLREALARVPGVAPDEIDDVIVGCAMPEAEQGLNVARIASLRAGVPVSASAVTVNRFCSSGLQAIAYGAERIMAGGAGAVLAGGTESMSLVPMGGHKVSPNPALMTSYPDVYLTTGLVAGKITEQTSRGLLIDVALGLIGAVAGGWLYAAFGGARIGGLDDVSLVVSLCCAVLVLVGRHVLVEGRLGKPPQG